MPKHTRPNNTIDRQLPAGYQWLHRLVNQRSFKIAVFIIVCILNIVDLLVDWYFFMSKTTIQQVKEIFFLFKINLNSCLFFLVHLGSCIRSTTTSNSLSHFFLSVSFQQQRVYLKSFKLFVIHIKIVSHLSLVR